MSHAGEAHVDVPWNGHMVQIEHHWLGRERHAAPLLVFLHEGLGSCSAWKDFPQRLCDAAQCRGLVYSRPGYGRSTAHPADAIWDVDFLHRQALELLPALLAALGVDATSHPPWLFGHSDGGSIALLYAAAFPREVGGLIVMAPHILVEELSVASIEQARRDFHETNLRERLARHHDDPDVAFRRWNEIWLNPAFRRWSIESELDRIECPVLAMQGLEDPYGTLEQVYGIARRLPRTQVLELAQCGHSPHRDQPEQVIAASTEFLHRQPPGDRR